MYWFKPTLKEITNIIQCSQRTIYHYLISEIKELIFKHIKYEKHKAKEMESCEAGLQTFWVKGKRMDRDRVRENHGTHTQETGK